MCSLTRTVNQRFVLGNIGIYREHTLGRRDKGIDHQINPEKISPGAGGEVGIQVGKKEMVGPL